MKIAPFLLAASAAITTLGAAEKMPSVNFLWYEQPARVRDMKLPWGTKSGNLNDETNNPKNPWEQQALPIGNGRIGAMVFGGDKTERLALNEVSFWSGGENPGGGYDNGPKVGRDKFGCYLPFGDLIVGFEGASETKNYTRSLNLEDGIARVRYKKNSVEYKREIFASEPAQVIVMNCETSQPGKFGAKLTFKPSVASTISASGSSLVMSGKLENGLEFEAVAVVIPQKGRVAAHGGKKLITPESDKDEAETIMSGNPFLEVDGAQGMTVIISMATDYVMDEGKNWKGASPAKRNKAYLSKAVKKPFKELKAEHIAFYQKLFNRLKLDLGKTDPKVAALPTDQRIKAYKKTTMNRTPSWKRPSTSTVAMRSSQGRAPGTFQRTYRASGTTRSPRHGTAITTTTSTFKCAIGGLKSLTSANVMYPCSTSSRRWLPVCGAPCRTATNSSPKTAVPFAAGRRARRKTSGVEAAGPGTRPLRHGMPCTCGSITSLHKANLT